MKQRQITATDGVSLSYRVIGAGPAVMLLHGFAQHGQLWIKNGVAQRLSADFTLILPDRRGHGASGKPHQVQDYGLHMVQDIFDILDAEGQGAAHLVGYSQGAELAWRAALMQPQRLRSVYLMASGWPGPDLELALEHYGANTDWVLQVDAQIRQWLTPEPDLDALAAVGASMGQIIDVPAADMAQLAVPAFGLAGADDPERGTIERIADLVPGFGYEILPDTDHLGTCTHGDLPGKIAGFLSQFIAAGSGPE
ncbi:MAG: alpha/beta hydrolase [Mangrovicoccus sp.]|nr:alpha/beta hydrolase [Mangrovicoccus sp.]